MISNIECSDVPKNKSPSAQEDKNIEDESDIHHSSVHQTNHTETTDQATISSWLLKQFMDITPVVEGKLARNKIVKAKEFQRSQEMKEYSNFHILIIKFLEIKFGIAKHFISNSHNKKYNYNTK